MLSGYLAALIVVLAALVVPIDRRLARAFDDDLTDSLVATAQAVFHALPPDRSQHQAAVNRLGRELGVQITVLDATGIAFAHSQPDPTASTDEAARPEVRAALDDRVGVATRADPIGGTMRRYVALPTRLGTVVRVSQRTTEIAERLADIRWTMGIAFVLALGVGAALSIAIARRVTRPLKGMTEAATALAKGDLEARVPETGTTELVRLAATLNRMAEDLSSRIEEASQDRRTRDLVLAAMDEGIILIDPEDEVQYANPAALRLIGRMAPEPSHIGTSGKPFMRVVLRRLVTDARSAGSIVQEEIEIGRPVRTVLASAFPVGGEGLALLVLRDVTEARRVDAIRRDFVAAASHELKTPVASIQAAAETLGHALYEDPEAARRFARNLLRDAERLSRIVRDLLDLSRLEGERGTVEPVRLDLLAREEVDRISDATRDAGLAIDTVLTPATVRGSRQDLSLLISNLLDNAVRYTRPGGTVRIDVAGRNGEATLAVSDTGIGIPARELPRIFERFYRVDRARSRETGGTGLGLAIVKHVAEQHGGRVEARSELGLGSTFIVSIPSSD